MKKNHAWLFVGLSFFLLTNCNKENTTNTNSASTTFTDFYVIDFRAIYPRPGLTFLNVSPFQQTTEYTCGPASVITLLRYYNIPGDEMTIASEMGTSTTCGTNPDQMTNWLNEHGFVATWYQHGNLDTIMNRLKRKIPVLVEWSDWGGHWVLACGYDTRNTVDLMDDVIIFADPYDRHDDLQDGYTWFNAQRFYYMWYDALLFGSVMKQIYIDAKPAV